MARTGTLLAVIKRSFQTQFLVWLGGFFLACALLLFLFSKTAKISPQKIQFWQTEIESKLDDARAKLEQDPPWQSCTRTSASWSACFQALPQDQEHLIWDRNQRDWIYWTSTSWPVHQIDSPELTLAKWSLLSVDNGVWATYSFKTDKYGHFRAWNVKEMLPDAVNIALDSNQRGSFPLKLSQVRQTVYIKADRQKQSRLNFILKFFLCCGLFFLGIEAHRKIEKKFQHFFPAIFGFTGIAFIGILLIRIILESRKVELWSGLTFIGHGSENILEWVYALAVLTFIWIKTPNILNIVPPRWLKKTTGSFRAGIYFFTLLLTFYLAIASIRYTVFHHISISQSNTLIRWSFANILWYGGVVVFIASVFVMSYRLHQSVLDLKLGLDKKLLSLLGAGIIFLPIPIYFPVDVHPFAFFILSFMIIILLDLFAENVSGGLTWPFIWLTILSACTSLLVFTFTTLNDQQEQKKLLGQWINKEISPDKIDRNYYWAKYREGKPVYQKGPLSGIPRKTGKSWFDSPSNAFKTDQGTYFVDRHKDSIYVLGKKKMGLNEPFSLYAFFFVLWVLVAIILLLINKSLKLMPKDWDFNWTALPSLRKRIQFYILAGTVGSVASIAWVTYIYFEYQRQEQSEQLALNITSATARDFLENWEKNPNSNLDSLFRTVQMKNQSSGSLYDRKGIKLSGSGPPLLPASVVRPAFFGDQNIRIRQGEFYHKLNIGEKREAILKFDAQEESMNIGLALKQIILTLLNIYVFLFVFTGGIAVAVSNSITAPLKVLSERLKSLKLGKKNVPLNWEKKDELGELIKDYNRMILQLEESAKILATKERDTAWREMAKQVAHEIKNPLTPMKLSLQHLQFAIENNSPNKEKMFAKVSATLIEQIDNLNRIASEFSSFAKMPEPENKEVSLNEVVASIHDLFRERKDMEIRIFVPIDDLRVFADKDHLLRVMSNLIKNAIQAIPEERRGKIVIKLYKEEDKAVILVADNGKGIKDELKEKVFKPNFTSKSSGTGLGLAICANIIEGFNGKIYFETEVNKGTDFYVVIPLMRTKENFFRRERVTL